jgi:hypothetical protein
MLGMPIVEPRLLRPGMPIVEPRLLRPGIPSAEARLLRPEEILPFSSGSLEELPWLEELPLPLSLFWDLKRLSWDLKRLSSDLMSRKPRMSSNEPTEELLPAELLAFGFGSNACVRHCGITLRQCLAASVLDG